MTANAFVEDRAACPAAGMNDHVPKPVDPEHLYATLLRWLPLRTAGAEAPAADCGGSRPSDRASMPLADRLAIRALAAPRHNRDMDVDPQQFIESADDGAADNRKSALLNTFVAITVALLATFMGVCKVKDDNIVQAMQQAQADKLDHWNFYQARNVRQDLAEATATQLRLARIGRTGAEAAAYDEAIARYDAKAASESQKKAQLKAQAEQDRKSYDSLNYRDDQFDLSDAALAIAIALLAVAALTKLWWMYWLSWVPIGFGVLMGLSGLLGWAVHPDTLTRLLS